MFIYYRTHYAKDSKDLKVALDKDVHKFLQKNANVGLIVGIIKNEKQLIKGYGLTNKDSKKIPDKNSIFELA